MHVLPFDPERMVRSLSASGTTERGTFDDHGTIDPMRFLARVYEATNLERFRESFHRGLDFILAAQYPSGGGEPGIELYIDQAVFHEVFCGDLPAEQAAVMAVSQRPGAAAGFGEPSGPVGWKTLPSWALISPNDLTIGATGLRLMAERAGAVIVEVDASHVAMISQPQAVTDLIVSALGTIG